MHRNTHPTRSKATAWPRPLAAVFLLACLLTSLCRSAPSSTTAGLPPIVIVNVAPFTGADPQRTAPYDRFVFNIRASYREETRALVRYLYNQGYRRIGFLGQADANRKSGEIGVKAQTANGQWLPVPTP